MHRALHLVLMVTGGEALCHIIDQGFYKHAESPTQISLIRIHVFGFLGFFFFCRIFVFIEEQLFVMVSSFLSSGPFYSLVTSRLPPRLSVQTHS